MHSVHYAIDHSLPKADALCHYDAKNSGVRDRTHDLWIQKRACYPLHHSALVGYRARNLYLYPLNLYLTFAYKTNINTASNSDEVQVRTKKAMMCVFWDFKIPIMVRHVPRGYRRPCEQSKYHDTGWCMQAMQ